MCREVADCNGESFSVRSYRTVGRSIDEAAEMFAVMSCTKYRAGSRVCRLTRDAVERQISGYPWNLNTNCCNRTIYSLSLSYRERYE